MNLSVGNKYDLALHGVPMCAVCNKPVEKIESWYDPASIKKVFRVQCHGQSEIATLSDELIEDTDSIRMGQAFIDKLPQPQLERK
jgi:hypothetical protein